MELIVKFLPLFGVLGLGFVFWKNTWVTKQDEGEEKMARIAKNIAEGAMSFLKAEYKLLSIFVLISEDLEIMAPPSRVVNIFVA